MNLTTQKVCKNLPEYYKIKQLFKRAFPKKEQLPMWVLQLRAISKCIKFLAYYNDEDFCGFTYTAENENTIFVLYLAVDDEIRSKGYGSAILNNLKINSNEKVIVLNVEPLDSNAGNYEQRLKRIEFYQRNGFENTNLHISENEDNYLILSTAKDFSYKEYAAVMKKLSCGLYVPKIESLSQ